METVCCTTVRCRLADYAHDAWSSWMKYLFSKSQRGVGGEVIIPTAYVINLERQIVTPYDELSELEKNSDLAEADKIIDIVRADLLRAFDRLTQLETVLDQVEWVGVPPICPWCHGFKYYGGHYPGCMRQQAMKR